jgi:hypothetical protein
MDPFNYYLKHFLRFVQRNTENHLVSDVWYKIEWTGTSKNYICSMNVAVHLCTKWRSVSLNGLEERREAQGQGHRAVMTIPQRGA